MKVLMFGWEFPPHISGGLGTACYGLLRGLLKNGVKVHFVVPRLQGGEDHNAFDLVNASEVELGDDEIHELRRKYITNFTVEEIDTLLKPYQTETSYKTSFQRKEEKIHILKTKTYQFEGGYGHNLYEEVFRYAQIAGQIARKKDFDIIHCHDWLTYQAGMEAKKVSGKPLFVHVHATEFDRSGKNVNKKVFNLEKAGMKIADRVIVVSDLTKKIVIEKYNIEPDRVYTAYNAIDDKEGLERIKPLFPQKVVSFLGRITFQKGPVYFIEAAKLVLNKYPNVRFVMAGSGDLLHSMMEKASHLRISSHFHFTGFLKGGQVDQLLGMTDVYVMPSVSEPFGLSALEAMQAGVPVIISKQSGVAEVLDYAVKVDFWDVNALADAIYKLLSKEAYSNELRSQARKDLGRLSWENAASRVKEIYKTLNQS